MTDKQSDAAKAMQRFIEIRERLNNLPGDEWRYDDYTRMVGNFYVRGGKGTICEVRCRHDDKPAIGRFIANAHQDIPWLLDQLAAKDARIAELENELAQRNRDVNHMLNRMTNIDRDCKDATTARESAEAKLREAVEVMKPFAEYARIFEWNETHGAATDDSPWCMIRGINITVGHFRAARAFVASTPDTEEFRAHLKWASEVVAKWPEWKRNILGSCKTSAPSQPDPRDGEIERLKERYEKLRQYAVRLERARADAHRRLTAIGKQSDFTPFVVDMHSEKALVEPIT